MKKLYIITDNNKNSATEKFGICSENRGFCEEYLSLYGKEAFIEEIVMCELEDFIEHVFIFVFNKYAMLEKNYVVEFCEDRDNWNIKIDFNGNFIVPVYSIVGDIGFFEAFLLAKQRIKSKIL